MPRRQHFTMIVAPPFNYNFDFDFNFNVFSNNHGNNSETGNCNIAIIVQGLLSFGYLATAECVIITAGIAWSELDNASSSWHRRPCY